jgi:peptidoglycan/LPS O-acetylase OafA/YrhL
MRYKTKIDRPATSLTAHLIAYIMITLTGSLLLASTCAATAAIIGFSRQFRKIRVLELLGSISYSLYLTHVLIGGKIVNLGSRYSQDALFDFGLSFFAIIACMGFACVTTSQLSDLPFYYPGLPATLWG